jgi:Holliday junction resolvase RusA-like endonuclease
MPEPISHTFDLPVPPSVNRTRKVDWRGKALRDDWKGRADILVLAQAQGRPQTIAGQFEATITLRDGATRMDLDNAAKEVIDYARRIELVANDGPKHMRRLVVQWGAAPSVATSVTRTRALGLLHLRHPTLVVRTGTSGWCQNRL